MVGKKSGKALLREEGLERTDNNMDLTSWPVVNPINQKNYYTEYLKRDDQILAYRLQQEDARNRMTKQAKDRDRALAQGRPVGPDGDVEMDDDQEDGEDEAASGSKTIVVHLGSQNMRIGLASDALPKTVPMVIAKKAYTNESEEGDPEPRPKRLKLGDEALLEPEKMFGEDFANQYATMCAELKIHMRLNKRRVLPNSKELVVNYNRRTVPDTISEHNDASRIDWTEIPAHVKSTPEYITGREALRIPEQSRPRYKLYWPLRYGWINERDYSSKKFVYQDIYKIIEDTVRSQLGLPLRTRRDWAQYGCVFIIPDLYDRNYVTGLLDMALADFGFGRVCFFQESLAASFGAGYTTTCIVDIGAQKTSICCVEEGMCIENSRVNLKYGGEDVTETFIKMMLFDHFPYVDINLRRRYDFLLAEELKQKFCTMNEADISVQTFDFHLRASGQDTRKYTFKCYDEVLLAPMGFFKPSIFDDSGKLEGRRRLVDRSYDIYDGAPNDPTSTAQAEILTAIAPALPPANGFNVTNGNIGENDHLGDKARPQSFNRLQESEATPRSSIVGSPARDLDATPQPGTPAAQENGIHEDEEEPPSIERRDDIMATYPLSSAILASIIHGSRGSPQKTRDFLGGIMLIGGSSVIPGLASFLEETMQIARPGYAKEIMIGRPPRELDAQVVVWKGGSVFGKLSKSNDSWVSQSLYERLGERVLANKCMWAW